MSAPTIEPRHSADHTTTQMFEAVPPRRRRTVRILGRSIPLPVAIAAILGFTGVALAAVLLTQTVSGTATVTSVAADGKITTEVVGTDSAKLKCAGKVAVNTTDFVFNPVLSKPEGSGTGPISGATCTVTLTVHNRTDDAVKISNLNVTLPHGWNRSDPTGNATEGIPSNNDGTASFTVTANQDAETGPITGQIQYADTES